MRLGDGVHGVSEGEQPEGRAGEVLRVQQGGPGGCCATTAIPSTPDASALRLMKMWVMVRLRPAVCCVHVTTRQEGLLVEVRSGTTVVCGDKPGGELAARGEPTS